MKKEISDKLQFKIVCISLGGMSSYERDVLCDSIVSFKDHLGFNKIKMVGNSAFVTVPKGCDVLSKLNELSEIASVDFDYKY